ncbi:hypothetical protein WN944_022404 [Citrus x changshan-huyou]|uniref:Uncharacterized protein n=1 Tax=Citrus x changshan-huyou TaxID=2935761 RepID=A0AAP0MYG5_9ROSI
MGDMAGSRSRVPGRVFGSVVGSENPNTKDGELLRHPKGRNELQKEVFAALFNAAEKSDEFPEITVKTEWRSKALGKVVSELPEALVPEYKANVVHLQQDNKTGFLISASYWRTSGKLYTDISAITNGNYDMNIFSHLGSCVTDILCGSGMLKILQ